jgi:lycopene beta-cyclase
LVFDARHQGSENLRNLQKSNHIFLNQTFLGVTVKFPRPVFEVDNAVLMDFRTQQSNSGINFIYVLPYSEREALIESTCFSANFFDPEKHRRAVEKYTRENFGDDYQIKSEESGKLPMTTVTFPVKSGERFYSIGVAGGSARPSSGYAFHRILRQTSRIARAIVQKEPIPRNFDSLKYRFLDAVFLESIARHPKSAKEFFLQMFAGADADSLIRFLLDESSLRDDSAVISALPKIPFGVAFGQSLQRRFTRQNGQNKQLQASLENLFDSVGKPFRRLSDWRVGR